MTCSCSLKENNDKAKLSDIKWKLSDCIKQL